MGAFSLICLIIPDSIASVIHIALRDQGFVMSVGHEVLPEEVQTLT